MKILVAPPGAGLQTLAHLTSNAIDVDGLLQLSAIYRQMTQRFGAGWYFNEVATKAKDFEVAGARLLLDKHDSFAKRVIVTAETALVRLLDEVIVAVPPAEALFAEQVKRQQLLETLENTGTPVDWSCAHNFIYPDIPTVEGIRAYYLGFARHNDFRVMDDAGVALIELLN